MGVRGVRGVNFFFFKLFFFENFFLNIFFEFFFLKFLWFLVGFHLFPRWFHGFCLVSMVFQGGFMVFAWFPWFFKVSRWIFIVIKGPRLVKSELSAAGAK